jgi:hypothetical protein
MNKNNLKLYSQQGIKIYKVNKNVIKLDFK